MKEGFAVYLYTFYITVVCRVNYVLGDFSRLLVRSNCVYTVGRSILVTIYTVYKLSCIGHPLFSYLLCVMTTILHRN